MPRPLPLLIAIAVLAAACGQETTSTTVATTAAPEAVLLSYKFEPGTELSYEVELQQHITMSAFGDPSAMGGEEVPGNADLDLTGVTTFTHTVEEGAEPGTFDITIVGEFTNLAVTGTVDGEPVDSGEIPDLAQIHPVRNTVTVDEKGNVLSATDGSMGPAAALGGELSGMGAMATPGMDLGSPVGPSLAEDEVTVGDRWSHSVESPMPFGGEPITTSVENRVTGTEVLDGVEVFVIETLSSTSAIDLDLREMMIGFFQGFMSEETTAEERAELEAMMEGLRFSMIVEPSSYLSTTWFDRDAGYARRSESSGTTRMTFDINFPDEATGDMVAFTMDMTMDQLVVYRFLDVGSA